MTSARREMEFVLVIVTLFASAVFFAISPLVFRGASILGPSNIGSVVFEWHPEGVRCYDQDADRVQFNYGSVSGDSNYGQGYVSMKPDEGYVGGIECDVAFPDSVMDVQKSSPTYDFERFGFSGYGPLKVGSALVFEFHPIINGGQTWENATSKSATVSCTAKVCDNARGIGSCDFINDLDFYSSSLQSCS